MVRFVLTPQDRPVWATALHAGPRLGELQALRVEDVDLVGKWLGGNGGSGGFQPIGAESATPN